MHHYAYHRLMDLVEWERPSERVCELMRSGAEIVVNVPQEWLEEMDRATLSSEYMRTIAGDPVLAGTTERSNRAELDHGAASNTSPPGEPVPANLGAAPLAIARDLVRRGLDESAVDAYRIGQNVAWRFWMQIAFGLTSDPQELRELLDVSSLSINSFIDATIAGIYRQMEIEREELTGGTHAERREAVELILDGAPITRQRAESKLGYRLDQRHTAAVVWGGEPDTDLSDLDRAVEALTPAGEGRRPLSVPAGAAPRLVWLLGRDSPALARAAAALEQLPGVRIAVGPDAAGIEGFRRSRLDAITTQRMVV